jgi:hypothetical protein
MSVRQENVKWVDVSNALALSPESSPPITLHDSSTQESLN